MGYTIQQRNGKKGRSYRVLLRHHSRFLKVNESRTFPTKREAITWAEEYEHSLKQNGGKPQPRLTVLTLHDAIVRYEQEVVPYKAPSTQHTERAGRRYFDERLGHVILTHLTGSMLSACITDVMKTHKLSTSKRYFALINTVLNQCVEWDLLSRSSVAER